MDDKAAIDILTRLLEKYPAQSEEQEAIRTAIGILAWTSLRKGRMENIKRAREKRTDIEKHRAI